GEKNSAGLRSCSECMASGCGFQRASAQSYDVVRRLERGDEGLGLHGTEGRLAAFRKDARDCAAVALLDETVEVNESPAEPLGEAAAHSAFAGTHEACEHDAFDGPRRIGVVRPWCRTGFGCSGGHRVRGVSDPMVSVAR